MHQQRNTTGVLNKILCWLMYDTDVAKNFVYSTKARPRHAPHQSHVANATLTWCRLVIPDILYPKRSRTPHPLAPEENSGHTTTCSRHGPRIGWTLSELRWHQVGLRCKLLYMPDIERSTKLLRGIRLHPRRTLAPRR